MSVLIKGTSSNIPSKKDGRLYRYEVVLNGNADRFYSDSALEIAEKIIPGYSPSQSDEQNLKAIIAHATRVQVVMQSQYTSSHPLEFSNLNADARSFLNEPFTTEPPKKWDSTLPLVLVDALYIPFTNTPLPIAHVDEEGNSNILLLRTTKGVNQYLTSLDEVGFISLSISKEVVT